MTTGDALRCPYCRSSWFDRSGCDRRCLTDPATPSDRAIRWARYIYKMLGVLGRVGAGTIKTIFRSILMFSWMILLMWLDVFARFDLPTPTIEQAIGVAIIVAVAVET